MTDLERDRELLELAAKAAGMEWRWDMPRGHKGDGFFRARVPGSGDAFPIWSPLTDDGDAFRLAVKLNIGIDWNDCGCCATAYGAFTYDDSNYVKERYQWLDEAIQDKCAATRRAIVRAAAEIGAAMKEQQ